MVHKVERHKHVNTSYTIHKRKTANFLVKCAAVLIVVGAIGGVAYNAGFLPIKELLSVKEPVGSSVPLDVDSYMAAYPELAEIPNLNRIKYEAFGTDESTSVVISEYTQQLEAEGYHLEYEGTTEMGGNSFRFVGFLKGLTAVGIISIDDPTEDVGHDTVVLYATGNAFDFKEILDWYQNI